MILTDTHTHLYVKQFDADRSEMVQRAISSAVQRMFLPNIDLASIEPLNQLAAEFPDNCFPMMGLHPCDVKEDWKQVLPKIEEEFYKGKYIGVGEIGIDLYWDKTTLEVQSHCFLEQCRWADEKGMAVSIHSRDATQVCINLLKKAAFKNIKGVFHCFTGSYEEAQEIIALGFSLGIGGVVTYKNTDLRETLARIDLKHIVMETDAPYLAPVPYRGKRNESMYILEVANTLADVYKMSLAQIAESTTENSKNIFGV